MFVNGGYVGHDLLPIWAFDRNHIVDIQNRNHPNLNKSYVIRDIEWHTIVFNRMTSQDWWELTSYKHHNTKHCNMRVNKHHIKQAKNISLSLSLVPLRPKKRRVRNFFFWCESSVRSRVFSRGGKCVLEHRRPYHRSNSKRS